MNIVRLVTAGVDGLVDVSSSSILRLQLRGVRQSRGARKVSRVPGLAIGATLHLCAFTTGCIDDDGDDDDDDDDDDEYDDDDDDESCNERI